MFENPDTRRQLVNGRLENGLRDAANRRLAGAARVRAGHHVPHIRPRMPHLSWFNRSARRIPTPAPTPKPSHA